VRGERKQHDGAYAQQVNAGVDQGRHTRQGSENWKKKNELQKSDSKPFMPVSKGKTVQKKKGHVLKNVSF